MKKATIPIWPLFQLKSAQVISLLAIAKLTKLSIKIRCKTITTTEFKKLLHDYKNSEASSIFKDITSKNGCSLTEALSELNLILEESHFKEALSHSMNYNQSLAKSNTISKTNKKETIKAPVKDQSSSPSKQIKENGGYLQHYLDSPKEKGSEASRKKIDFSSIISSTTQYPIKTLPYQLNKSIKDLPDDISIVPTKRIHADCEFNQKTSLTSKYILYKSKTSISIRSKRNQTAYYVINQSFYVPPIGLQNIGNSCYFNTALHLIKFSYPFSYYLKLNNPSRSKFPFKDEITKLYSCLWSSNERVVNPSSVFHELHNQCDKFVQGYQSDSYEALIKMLNIYHEQTQTSSYSKGFSCPMIPMPKVITKDVVADGINQINAYENSIVYDLFANVGLWEYECTLCNESKARFGLKIGLELDIEENNTIESSLKAFFAKSKFADYKCPSCKAVADVCLQFHWTSASPILIFQIKRFFLRKGKYVKNSKEVRCPKTLDIKDYLGKDLCKASEYKLVGIGNHSGSLEGGHYYAYGYDITEQCWGEYNDSSVCKKIKINKCSSNAITLVYLRKDLMNIEKFWVKDELAKLSLLQRLN